MVLRYCLLLVGLVKEEGGGLQRADPLVYLKVGLTLTLPVAGCRAPAAVATMPSVAPLILFPQLIFKAYFIKIINKTLILLIIIIIKI